MRTRPIVRALSFMAIVVVVGGCSCSDDPGATGGDGGAGMDAALGGDGGSADGATTGMDARPTADALVTRDGEVVIMEDGGFSFVCTVTMCDGHLLECGDCVDNDGDGFVDPRDPECLGPCDNTEGPILLAGVGGESGGPCKSDCYFDFGNGSGNDDCYWDHRCDPLSVDPRFDPEGPSCAFEADRVGSRDCPDTQSDTCLEVCRPITPNGCDCFGCCTFDAITDRPAAEGGDYVWIGSRDPDTDEGSCTLEDVTDIDRCRPCTPVPGCFNDCGRCELCIGRSTLPADCTPPPPPPDAGPRDAAGSDAQTPDAGPPPPARCDLGVQPCGLAGDLHCPMDYYCVTGCCVPTLI